MELDEAKSLVKQVVQGVLENPASVSDDAQLIGGEALLDSMKLVEVCLALEDAAEEKGFAFDWTSETAMSKSRSMFRTIESLAEELAEQSQGAS